MKFHPPFISSDSYTVSFVCELFFIVDDVPSGLVLPMVSSRLSEIVVLLVFPPGVDNNCWLFWLNTPLLHDNLLHLVSTCSLLGSSRLVYLDPVDPFLNSFVIHGALGVQFS